MSADQTFILLRSFCLKTVRWIKKIPPFPRWIKYAIQDLLLYVFAVGSIILLYYFFFLR